jgi:hypothetical protein
VDSTDPSLESDAAEPDGHTSRRIRADVSTKEGEISVNNYDWNTPTKFMDCGTVLALRALGIQPDEFFIPSHKEVAQFGGDPDVRGFFLAHHSTRIDKLRKLVRRERAKILDREANSGEPSVSISGAVKMERRQVERLKVPQKREVEAMIDSLLQLDRLQKSMEEAQRKDAEKRHQAEEERRMCNIEAHQRHVQHMKEMQESEQRRLQEEEARRQAQHERTQRALEQQEKMAQ